MQVQYLYFHKGNFLTTIVDILYYVLSGAHCVQACPSDLKGSWDHMVSVLLHTFYSFSTCTPGRAVQYEIFPMSYVMGVYVTI